MRGTALETRRRLRPVARPFGALFAGVLGRIAPLVTYPILLLLRLFAGDGVRDLHGRREGLRLAGHPGRSCRHGHLALRSLAHVQPRGTLAFVAAGAAVALGVSQFFDYQAVVAGASDYAGEVRTVAPPPVTARRGRRERPPLPAAPRRHRSSRAGLGDVSGQLAAGPLGHGARAARDRRHADRRPSAGTGRRGRLGGLQRKQGGADRGVLGSARLLGGACNQRIRAGHGGPP